MRTLLAAALSPEAQIKVIVDFLLDNTAEAALDVVNAIPTADQNDSVTIYNDGGVLKVSTAP